MLALSGASDLMLLLLPVLLPLGFLIPGLFIAKYLRRGLWWAAAFPFSLIVLFHIVFWLGVFHISLTLWSAAPCLAAVCAGAAWLAGGERWRAAAKPSPPSSVGDCILLVSIGIGAAALVAHAIASPLPDGDTFFRWDFLAQRILSFRNFTYYPPVTASDFHAYFYPDGIPPLVSFSYWWLYASAGAHVRELTSILLAMQFACTLAFTYGTAATLFPRRTALLAAAILASCGLYFDSVVLGQETGLTALSVAAMLYFIVTGDGKDDLRAMAAAALAAALCALSREYGWIAVVAGVIALVWRGQPRRLVALFVAIAVAAAAPWYVRNWIVAGNPFYSLRFLDFAVNPVHSAIMDYYNSVNGFAHARSDLLPRALFNAMLLGALAVLTGLVGGFQRFRERGYLFVVVALIGLVWLQSVGYTSGALEHSMRVLSPALVVLAILGAAALAPWTKDRSTFAAVIALVLVSQLWTAAQGMVFPASPFALHTGDWFNSMFHSPVRPMELEVRDQVLKYLPPGSRVLTDNAILHAALIDHGVDVVPVWSPEVRCLFAAPAEEAERCLRSHRIENVAYYPQSLNTQFLVSASPLYRALPQRWPPVVDAGDLFTIYRPSF
jgi:hypothetical protein